MTSVSRSLTPPVGSDALLLAMRDAHAELTAMVGERPPDRFEVEVTVTLLDDDE